MPGLGRLAVVAALLEMVMANANLMNIEKREAHPFPDLYHHLEARQVDGEGCLSLLAISSSCAAASPSFTRLPQTAQLSCYCATPTRFDGALASCTPYLSSVDPDIYSSFAGALSQSPCASLVGGGGSGATATSSTTTAVTRTATTTSIGTSRSTITSIASDPYLAACSSVISIENSCETATPSLSTETAISAAYSCLCYTSSTYNPDYYDDPRSSCYEYLKTASPPVYQSFVKQSNTATAPCADLGGGGTTSTTTRRTTTTTGRATTTTTSRPAASTSATGGGPNDGVSLNIRGAYFMAFAGTMTLVLALVL